MSLYKDDPYQVLGVAPDATETDIKKAYRKLALKFHPDRHTDPADKEEATSKFAAIAGAYEILTDTHLRNEYDRTQKEESASGASSGMKSKKSNDTGPAPFRYHFSDPYEVFKDDFRDQFGMEYPGAQYDWIDFDAPMMGSQQPMLTNGSDTAPKKKKGLFSRFRKNKANKNSDQAPAGSSGGSIVPYQGTPTTALATTGGADNSRALVSAEKRNNRPVAMDVKTDTKGTISTTKMTITRPDGSVETVTMRSGIPGKAPPKHLALTNGGDVKKALPASTSTKKTKRLTNGSSKHAAAAPKPKLLGWSK